MNTDEIIELAKNIKMKYEGYSTLEIIEQLKINIGYTNLKPNIYPAYTMNYGNLKRIVLNNHFNVRQQNILAAHELGHALLHENNYYNAFGGEYPQQEYEANLFAITLLFDETLLNVNLNRMSNYELKFLLDHNIKINN